MSIETNRREWFLSASAALAVGAGAAPAGRERDEPADDEAPFGFCLNTSTLQGFNLPIDEIVSIASKAGYTAIEPWIRELDRYAENGGNLEELGTKIRDAGLMVPSAIGFFDWAVDDDERRRAGFEEARRCMKLVRQIGGTRIAAPPAGATDRSDLDLGQVAVRYRQLLEVGDDLGVVPQVEVWGFSKTLGKLGEAALVAVEAGRPDACILPDVYHLYKGGSGFAGLRMLSGRAIHVFHLNDYPAQPPRDRIADSDRIFPGDGIAPLDDVIRDLRAIGFRGALSLELFNREYWKRDPEWLARTGLEKMKSAVERALKTPEDA